MPAGPPSPLIKWTFVTTVAQLVMVVGGHYSPAVAGLFAVGGTLISALGGLACAAASPPGPPGRAAGAGALVGGVSALLGILVSHLLGDVPAATLAIGTAASAVAGALGGGLGGLARRRGHAT